MNNLLNAFTGVCGKKIIVIFPLFNRTKWSIVWRLSLPCKVRSNNMMIMKFVSQSQISALKKFSLIQFNVKIQYFEPVWLNEKFFSHTREKIEQITAKHMTCKRAAKLIFIAAIKYMKPGFLPHFCLIGSPFYHFYHFLGITFWVSNSCNLCRIIA